MPRSYQTKIWKLVMPDGCKAESDTEQKFVTLFKPDGVGLS
jgi:hypothetical protein